jgi:hypothetical protein
MRRHLFAAFVAICLPLAHAQDSLPNALPEEQEAAGILAAERIGLAMYRHDHAAAVATDAAFQLRQVREDARLRGWITEERQDQIIVSFIDETPRALYRVEVSKEGVVGEVMVLESPSELSAYESGAAAARLLAMATRFEPCAERYNTVVLPVDGANEQNWFVYLLPATTDANVIPIGGAYRMEINAGGLVEQRGFTNSCIALQPSPESVALAISHLLDPIPTEVHVFWSLWANKPLYVSTPPNATVWAIEGGKIRLVQRDAGAQE